MNPEFVCLLNKFDLGSGGGASKIVEKKSNHGVKGSPENRERRTGSSKEGLWVWWWFWFAAAEEKLSSEMPAKRKGWLIGIRCSTQSLSSELIIGE